VKLLESSIVVISTNSPPKGPLIDELVNLNHLISLDYWDYIVALILLLSLYYTVLNSYFTKNIL